MICKQGHELTTENLYVEWNGKTRCKACHLAHMKARYVAKREQALTYQKAYNRSVGSVLDSTLVPPGYMATKDAAKALGVWFNTIYRWIHAGAPHYRRFGRVWLNVERVKSWRINRDGMYQEEA